MNTFKIYLLTVIILTSCNSRSEKELTEKNSNNLPKNSATRLVTNMDTLSYELLEKPTALNLDITNGFRNLKLNTLIDSLYLLDWSKSNYGSKIQSYKKNISIVLDAEKYLAEFQIIFYNNILTILNINFNNIIGSILTDKKYIRTDEKESLDIKIKLLEIFYNTYGQGYLFSVNQGIESNLQPLTPKTYENLSEIINLKKYIYEHSFENFGKNPWSNLYEKKINELKEFNQWSYNSNLYNGKNVILICKEAHNFEIDLPRLKDHLTNHYSYKNTSLKFQFILKSNYKEYLYVLIEYLKLEKENFNKLRDSIKMNEVITNLKKASKEI